MAENSGMYLYSNIPIKCYWLRHAGTYHSSDEHSTIKYHPNPI